MGGPPLKEEIFTPPSAKNFPGGKKEKNFTPKENYKGTLEKNGKLMG